jgi:hypothetical protein
VKNLTQTEKMIYATTPSPSSIGTHYSRVNPIIIISVKVLLKKEGTFYLPTKIRQRSDVGSARERAGRKRNNE